MDFFYKQCNQLQKGIVGTCQKVMHPSPKISPEHLTIIITTSPVQSHPSTQIFDQSIESINKFESLQDIPIIIMCDSAKITTAEDKYKSGIVTQETMINYREYLRRLKEKYNDPKKYIFIQREKRYGFAQNIRYAMQNLTKTDHVMIYQHDHVINGVIDFATILQTMRKYPEQIQYISFMNKSYVNVVPKLISDQKMKYFLLDLLGWERNYNVITKIEEFTEGICEHFVGKYGLPLVPLAFWYDKIHIASRKYYLDVIFNPQGNYDPHVGKNQKTLSFVEDTFGHCMKWTIQDDPSTILKFGAFIHWTKEWVIYHNKGRSFITENIRQEKYLSKEKQDRIRNEAHIELEQEFYHQKQHQQISK